MEIVVEDVLLENFLINIIVLKSVSLLSREKGRLFWLAAAMAAAVNLVLPSLFIGIFGSFMLQIGLAFVCVCVSFNFKTLKKFVQPLFCYFVVNFIYGGACFFFEQMFSITHTIVALAVVVLTYLIFAFVMKKFHKKRKIDDFCFEVEVENAGKKFKTKAFLDSGNLLFDPLTKRPVTLVNFKFFSSLFSDIGLEDVLRKAEKLNRLSLGHYISIGTLSSDGKIFVFEVERMNIGGTSLEKPILGLSLSNFNSAFGTDMILHNNFASV